MRDFESHTPHDDGSPAARLGEAVRRSRVHLAAVIIPLCLLTVMVAAYFAPDWSDRVEDSTLGIFLVFLLVSLSEVVVLPAFLVSRAVQDYLDPERGGDAERFANIYAMGVLGGTTPCVLGLVSLRPLGAWGPVDHPLRLRAGHLLLQPEPVGGPGPLRPGPVRRGPLFAAGGGGGVARAGEGKARSLGPLGGRRRGRRRGRRLRIRKGRRAICSRPPASAIIRRTRIRG